MRKTSKSKKTAKARKQKRVEAPAAHWAEPAGYARDPLTRVAVTVNDDDRGTREATRHRPLARVTLDEGGQQRLVTKTVPFVQRLFDRGDIDREMLIRAQEFKTVYDTSSLDPLRAVDLGRMGSTGGALRIDEPLRVAAAKSTILKYREIFMRGRGEQMWHALEKIVGQEQNVTEAAGGRGKKRDQWVGHLIDALFFLVNYHQGYWKKMARCA